MGRLLASLVAGHLTSRFRAKASRLSRAKGRGGTSALLAMLLVLAAGHSLRGEGEPPRIRGLPFSRFYSFDEIGSVGPGARLGFDAFGRIAVIHSGAYVVLNDTTWLDISSKDDSSPPMQRVVFQPNGQACYGAQGEWGLVDVTPQGLLRPRSLCPANPPDWVAGSGFTEFEVTDRGVYFGGFNGVVYWDRQTNRQTYFAVPQLSRIFAVGGTVFASSRNLGVVMLDLQAQAVRPVTVPGAREMFVDQVTAFGPGRVLLANIDGQLMTFDGKRFEAWPGRELDRPQGRVTALRTLVDGSVAVAVNGKGLYFFSQQGEIRYSLTTAEYHRITDLATRERGVLWVSSESGIIKVFYESPLTMFGQRLGLPISWPQVVQWENRVVVASGGRLYESIPGPASEATRFKLVDNQPAAEAWGIAARGSRMLVGNSDGVFARSENGENFNPVLTNLDVSRLVMVNPDFCYVIGTAVITAVRWTDGRWVECADRIPGLGYPSVVHAAGKSAWIELGANRAARVTLKGGRLQARLFDDFPWKSPRWINVGIVGDTVVLSGMPDGRRFFDEKTEAFVEAPRLKRLLDGAPYSIGRVRQDASGSIWASYNHGLLVFRPVKDGYRIDSTDFGKINDFFPMIQLMPDGDGWLSTGQSLYHVDDRFAGETAASYQPTLVSLLDAQTNREIAPGIRSGGVASFPYAQNSLVFRFFAGSYSSRQLPTYEYRLNRGTDQWNPVGSGSLLALTDLREGNYRLDVRLGGAIGASLETLTFRFEIAPPWYRTWPAYALYALTGFAALIGLIYWFTHRSRKRNLVLEKLVDERTEALRVAMQQLNEETRNAATVAERDRLAGEIHDSLQQGLSGLMLQLDATLKLPGLSDDVRSRLGVARNMVSFTRHEVQNAVWDMETPLLEGTDLGEALRKLTGLIGPGTAGFAIAVHGEPFELAPALKHNLLRIAQEVITNAVRHAAASTITITLEYQSDRVRLTVSDDGNGFLPIDVLTKGIGHFGLRGLRGRANRIGGRLDIRSAPGEGTTVTVDVQIAAPAISHADAS